MLRRVFPLGLWSPLPSLNCHERPLLLISPRLFFTDGVLWLGRKYELGRNEAVHRGLQEGQIRRERQNWGAAGLRGQDIQLLLVVLDPCQIDIVQILLFS